MVEPSFTPVAALTDVPSGTTRAVSVAGLPILLCHDLHDGLFAVANRCSHLDQPLQCGRLRHGWIMCPAHGARFDLATGEPLNPPATESIATYPTRVVQGMVEVAV